MKRTLKTWYTPEQERVRRVQAAAFKRFALVWNLEEAVIDHLWHELERQQFSDKKAAESMGLFGFSFSVRKVRYFRRKVFFMVKMDGWAKKGKRPKNWSEIMRRET